MKNNVPIVTDLEKIQHYSRQFSQSVETDQVNELTGHAYSSSSLLALTKDWNLFVEFCHEKGVTMLPASSTAVRMYVEKASLKRKYATIKRYIVTISVIHRVLSYPDPTKNSRVQTALAAIRLDKKGDAHSTNAFTREHLDTLHQVLLHSPSIKDWRDLALYHVMFEGVLKRFELKQLSFNHLIINDDYIALMVGNEEITLSRAASLALYRWLNVRGNEGEFVFTAIDRHGNLSYEPLNDSSIYRILKNASERLGLSYHFSGQSLRVGAVQDLAKQGVKIRDIQYAGRWLSPAMPYQYVGNEARAELEKMRYLSFTHIER
ncbi:tyrosine-type recombinase/integrase [Vibrio panuliri]|uniref:Integrase n=1 Tax=Vibrio panuliri TaxID=1381081 RepID=A0ABX3FF53_9VIBR|nr:tyrosine-type recombinase/integrase [Vibrio panuliri]KAB1457389.1 tyrosine-type recombinase/integrase [Vibrio panuliri]OLQ91450.1 integrase [Vibrio panuliri]